MSDWPGLPIEQRREIFAAITPSDWPPSDAWIDARLRERGCPEDQFATWRGRIRSTIEREHCRKKHLGIFPAGGGCYGVCLCEGFDDLLSGRPILVTFLYFGTKNKAEAFVARVRAGISGDELAALVEAHKLPPERITIEELRRRADE
jgi:hypothetical protein